MAHPTATGNPANSKNTPAISAAPMSMTSVARGRDTLPVPPIAAKAVAAPCIENVRTKKNERGRSSRKMTRPSRKERSNSTATGRPKQAPAKERVFAVMAGGDPDLGLRNILEYSIGGLRQCRQHSTAHQRQPDQMGWVLSTRSSNTHMSRRTPEGTASNSCSTPAPSGTHCMLQALQYSSTSHIAASAGTPSRSSYNPSCRRGRARRWLPWVDRRRRQRCSVDEGLGTSGTASPSSGSPASSRGSG